MERIGISASGTLEREGWGLTRNHLLEAGRLMVGDEMKLEIESALVHEAARPQRGGLSKGTKSTAAYSPLLNGGPHMTPVTGDRNRWGPTRQRPLRHPSRLRAEERV